MNFSGILIGVLTFFLIGLFLEIFLFLCSYFSLILSLYDRLPQFDSPLDQL